MIKGLKKYTGRAHRNTRSIGGRTIRYTLLAGATVLATVGMTGCGKDIDGTATVAVCNDESIPLGVASLYARYQQAQMYSFYTGYFGTTEIFDNVADEETGETYGDTIKDDMMDSIKTMYVLKQHAADFDVTMSDENKTAIEEAAKAFMAENDANALKEMGVSESDVAALLELYSYQTWMYDAMIADVDQNVSDDEAAQTRVTYVKVSLDGTEQDEDGNTIPLTDEEKEEKEALAQKVLDEILASDDAASADMSEIAKTVDENLTSSTLVFGYTEDDTADTAIKDAVVGLKDGEVVDHVITSEDSNCLYVIRLEKEFDEDATESKKSMIISDREKEDYQEELDSWLEAASFEVKQDIWDQVVITDQKVYTFKAEETSDSTGEDTTQDTGASSDEDTSEE